MSNDDVSQAAQQASGQTEQTEQTAAANEIAEDFRRVVAAGYQPRLREVSGACVFNIAGAGVWRATITNGVPTMTHDGVDKAPANCTVECGAEDFLRIMRREGNLNILAAFLQGLVTITGDLSFASALLGGVTLDTADKTGAQQR